MSSIPIPSFTTAVSGSIFPDAAHDGKKASANRQQIKSKAKTRIAAADTINSRDNIIPARWNTRALMQLEVALQHWFRRQKATSINVEEFFALVLKLDWTKAKGVGAFEDSQLENLAVNAEKTTDKDVETNAVASHEKQCQGLQWEERLWHDFTCATTESFGDDTILYHFDKEQQMLELIPHSSDQMRLRLASKQRQCICLQQSAEILRMLKDYHKKQQQMKLTKQQKAAQLMAKNEVLVPKAAVITTGMTIDERVEARAKAKQDHELLLSEQKRKDPTRATDIDRTWMIQLADALWNHARTRLQRQNMRLPGKLASNCLLKPRGEENKEKEQLSSHNKRCVMTFSDVIQAISKSRLGEASSIQIAKALTELESYKDPSWIVVTRLTIKTATKIRISGPRQQPLFSSHQIIIQPCVAN